MSTFNVDAAEPPVQRPAHIEGGLRREGTAARLLRSCETVADGISGGLRAQRSAVSYDYLAGAGDERRVGDAQGRFSYHTGKKPTAGKSFDYLDEDQNRIPSAPYTRGSSIIVPTAGAVAPARPHGGGGGGGGAGGAHGYFDSDSDDEESMLDHQIRMLEAKKAAAAARRWANPGPVGLLGFGMTTILLNLHNSGHFTLNTPIPAMGICFGGGAQLIAGLLEWTRGNTFAYVAFTSYGAFWLSLVCVWMLPNASTGGAPAVQPGNQYFIGIYLSLWGVFSFFMMLCTLRMNVAIFLVFLTVTLLFLLLGGGNMTNNATALHAAGYEGIVCGSLALYLGVAEVVNEVWDRTVLPVVPMTQLLGWFGAGKHDSAAAQPGEKKER
ncbi:GPR1/FUN34/yaaH family [Novymonas esmeraldas]|uniref:GPR1/FUN34/yaaH family n=1 Tax=Novymonas esmeraldas TaxID=1808958 RepID=A0AAW0ENI4_9TRYP